MVSTSSVGNRPRLPSVEAASPENTLTRHSPQSPPITDDRFSVLSHVSKRLTAMNPLRSRGPSDHRALAGTAQRLNPLGGNSDWIHDAAMRRRELTAIPGDSHTGNMESVKEWITALADGIGSRSGDKSDVIACLRDVMTHCDEMLDKETRTAVLTGVGKALWQFNKLETIRQAARLICTWRHSSDVDVADVGNALVASLIAMTSKDKRQAILTQMSHWMVCRLSFIPKIGNEDERNAAAAVATTVCDGLTSFADIHAGKDIESRDGAHAIVLNGKKGLESLPDLQAVARVNAWVSDLHSADYEDVPSSSSGVI